MMNNDIQPKIIERNRSWGMEIIPHTVRDFGVEARKAGKSWEAAFNGPIQSWVMPRRGRRCMPSPSGCRG